MQSSFVRLLALFPILAAAACQQPGGGDYRDSDYRGGVNPPTALGGTMIVTDAARYPVGAPVLVRLTNKTGRTVGYNLCSAKLESVNSENDWRPTQSLGEVCTAELRGLRPEQSASYSFRPGPQLRRGQYRIRTELHDPQGGASIEAVSNMFMLNHDSNSD